jgi:hypothetical protein
MDEKSPNAEKLEYTRINAGVPLSKIMAAGSISYEACVNPQRSAFEPARRAHAPYYIFICGLPGS